MITSEDIRAGREKIASDILNFIRHQGLDEQTLTVLYHRYVTQLEHISCPAVDCDAGCSYCCHLRATASSAEILVLTNYLRRHADTAALLNEIDRIFPPVSTRDRQQERWWRSNQVPCIFLDSERQICRVYTVRPFSCRGYHSLNVEKCRKGYYQKAATPIPCYPDIKRSRELYSQSFARAMQIAGCRPGQLEVSSAVATLLKHPGQEIAWLLGASVEP